MPHPTNSDTPPTSPFIALRKVDSTRKSTLKSTPPIAQFAGISLHVTDLDSSLKFFQSLFQWSILRHEEYDHQDCTGEGVHNGSYSITYIGSSSSSFSIALIYNYGVNTPHDTSLHHIAISCNIDDILNIAKHHGYLITKQDGNTCIGMKGENYAFYLIPVQGEQQEKGKVLYVSLYTKSLIRSSDYYTTILSMSPSELSSQAKFHPDIKHVMLGYDASQVQLQLIQIKDSMEMAECRERLIWAWKDVSIISSKFQSTRNPMLDESKSMNISRDKDGYIMICLSEQEWNDKMKQGNSKISDQERLHRLEKTRSWMRNNAAPIPAPTPIARTVTPSTSLSSISSRDESSPSDCKSWGSPTPSTSTPFTSTPSTKTPSPSSSNSASSNHKSSPSSTISTSSSNSTTSLKLRNAKPRLSRLIHHNTNNNLHHDHSQCAQQIEEYQIMCETLQEQLIAKQNELNLVHDKIKGKMEQLREILKAQEDENYQLRQQLLQAKITPCVGHISIATLMSTPTQQIRKLSGEMMAPAISPPRPSGQVSTRATTPTTPPPGQSSRATTPTTPPPSGKSSSRATTPTTSSPTELKTPNATSPPSSGQSRQRSESNSPAPKPSKPLVERGTSVISTIATNIDSSNKTKPSDIIKRLNNPTTTTTSSPVPLPRRLTDSSVTSQMIKRFNASPQDECKQTEHHVTPEPTIIDTTPSEPTMPRFVESVE